MQVLSHTSHVVISIADVSIKLKITQGHRTRQVYRINLFLLKKEKRMILTSFDSTNPFLELF